METGNKYLRNVNVNNAGQVDVYDVLEAFGVECPARQHAIKKLLCAGIRGKGDAVQDLTEARDAIERAIELQKKRALPNIVCAMWAVMIGTT